MTSKTVLVSWDFDCCAEEVVAPELHELAATQTELSKEVKKPTTTSVSPKSTAFSSDEPKSSFLRRLIHGKGTEPDATSPSQIQTENPAQGPSPPPGTPASEPPTSQRTFQRVSLGSYESIYSQSLPGNVKFIDSHSHWCWTIQKLEKQGIRNYRDVRDSFAELFPPSYGGSIQVFCLPEFIKSYNSWFQKLAEGTEGEMWFTFGCHPHFVMEWNDELKAAIEYNMQEMSAGGRLVGFGEIGLDYNGRNNEEEKKEREREVYRIQLDMAVKMGLPVVIHCRNNDYDDQAEIDCLAITKERVPHDWPIHRHCFQRPMDTARNWMNYFTNVVFGFTPGIKTFAMQNSVWNLPLEKVVLETDAPFFIPSEMKNFPTENGSSKRVAIPGGLALAAACEIAKVKEIPVEDVVMQTTRNTLRLYGIEEKLAFRR